MDAVNEMYLTSFSLLPEKKQRAHLLEGLSCVLGRVQVQNDCLKGKEFEAEEAEIGYLRKELLELRRMLQKTEDIADNWKETQDALIQFEEQMRQLPIKQEFEERKMPSNNDKRDRLRYKSRDLEESLRWQITFIQDKIFYIEKNLERFQRRQAAKKEKKIQPDNLEMMKTVELRNTMEKQMTCTVRQLEKKDPIICKKEAQCRELKQRLSLNSETLWTLREKYEEIKSLKAYIIMFNKTADKYKHQNKTLTDKVVATHELYLKEKQKNMELKNNLRANSYKQPVGVGFQMQWQL